MVNTVTARAVARDAQIWNHETVRDPMFRLGVMVIGTAFTLSVS